MKLTSDYDRPIAESITVLADSGITDFPVNLKKIQRAYRNLFIIRSYSNLMTAHGFSREYCIENLRSEDGATVGSGHGTYIIYYNDEKSRSRNRFTIAHEMGHIFMGHFDSHGTVLGTNSEMDNVEYQFLENEANCFARNLLCPVVHVLKLFEEHGIKKYLDGYKYVWQMDTNKKTAITENLRTYYTPEKLLTENFDISEQAAQTRINLLSTDDTHSRTCLANYNSIEGIKINGRWVCHKCGAERVPSALYCVECGLNSGFIYSRSKKGCSYRKDIKVKNGKYTVCPVCGNKEISEGASFCRICGTELMNNCTRLSHHNLPEARYCSVCGSTTFYESKNLVSLVRETLSKDSYETVYGYDFLMKEDERFKSSSICRNSEVSGESVSNKSCEFPLSNCCVEVSPPDDYSGPLIIPHNNASDARFCEFCGQITQYYKAGLLKSWNEIKGVRINHI